MGKEDKAGTRRRLIYERDSGGKLTSEAKYELERLDKEVVKRQYKESKAEKEAFDEVFVNLDPEYVFRRKPQQRLKWIEKAFNGLLDNSIKANTIYDLISHAKFLEGVNQSVGVAIFELLEKNLGFFTVRQQKYFLSPRFQLYKKHAVMTILDSDDEAEPFQPVSKPLKDELKTVQQLRADREKEAELDEERERRAERMRQKDREARGGHSRSRSRSAKSRSRSRSRSSARSGSVPPPPPDDEDAPSAPKTRLGPKGKPKIERRIDPADGSMYTLADFVEEYGGTEDEPPPQWTNNKHTSFMYNE